VTPRRFLWSFVPLAACGLWAVAGCAGGGPSVTGPSTLLVQPHHIPNGPLGSSAITHVVIVIQENRSFDNLFHGFPGADTALTGKMHDGTTLTLQPVPLGDRFDPDHTYGSFRAALDSGKMDGFDYEPVYGLYQGKYQQVPGMQKYPYSYVQPSDVAPYNQLAGTYALADRMFQSNGGPSYPAHQYLIAGQSANAINGPPGWPWGCDSPAGSTVPVLNSSGGQVPGPFPCFGYTTLADLLDASRIGWRYYTPPITNVNGVYSAYDAVRQIRYGPDWSADVLSPETRVLSDVAAGRLAPVTWIVPSFPNSDHPGIGAVGGPQWVGTIVNAIGTSKFWDSTAIFIVWDDWGGWYDHAAPAQYDVMGLGFRVPLIVVSAYAKRGYVSHVEHEFGSILKFVEDDFGLPSMQSTDARSDNLVDCFDFTKKPAPFSPIHTRLDARYFLEGHPSLPPDSI
jgi:phospholipase C